MPNNPPKNDTPDKALVERLHLTEKLLQFALRCSSSNPASLGSAVNDAQSLLIAFGIEPRERGVFWHTDAADLTDARHRLAALSQPQHGGLVEAELLDDIATMMSEFVENWPSPKKTKTALALIAKTLRAALASNSPVVGEDAPCGHCGGVGDIDDGDHPCFICGGTGKRAKAKPTPTDTADRREAVAREIIARVVDRCRKLDDYANRRAWEKILSEEIQASLIAEPATSASLGEDRREAIARIIRQYCQHGVEPEPFGGSLDTADLAADAIASLIAGPLPEGFVAVPVEPTEAMLTEAVDNVGPIGCCNHTPDTARETWSAMLSAATPPSVGEGGGA